MVVLFSTVLAFVILVLFCYVCFVNSSFFFFFVAA